MYARRVEPVQNRGGHLADDIVLLDGDAEQRPAQDTQRGLHHRRFERYRPSVAPDVGEAFGLFAYRRDVRVEPFPEERRLDVFALTAPPLAFRQEDALSEDATELLARELALLVVVALADEDASNRPGIGHGTEVGTHHVVVSQVTVLPLESLVEPQDVRHHRPRLTHERQPARAGEVG